MSKPLVKMDVEATRFFHALDKFAREAKVPIAKANKAIALQFLAVVKQRTPVDTGAARAAWRIKSLYGGLECHVYNQIKYIVALEYGHSQQAPKGMVRISLAELTNNLLKEAHSAELQKYLASINIGMTRKQKAKYLQQAHKEKMRDIMENAGQ